MTPDLNVTTTTGGLKEMLRFMSLYKEHSGKNLDGSPYSAILAGFTCGLRAGGVRPHPLLLMSGVLKVPIDQLEKESPELAEMMAEIHEELKDENDHSRN